MIDIENVSFSYKDGKRVLNNITISITDGECILVYGESGSGKSTILKLINALILNYKNSCIEGNIYIDNKNIKDIPIYTLSEKVGTVFQNPKSQFFNVDVESELVFSLENSGVEREKMVIKLNEAVERFRIEKFLDKTIFELSGGEKQKIACASVYTTEPKIFLLDEPSSNLDEASIDVLKKILLDLKKQGKIIIIADHRVGYLKKIIDTAYILKEGEIHKKYNFEDSKDFNLELFKDVNRNLVDTRYKLLESNSHINFILEIKDLSYGYTKKRPLGKVSFEARSGDVIGILGKNGVGKSTLVKTICGTIKELSGEIRINHKKQNLKHRVKESYMVFQDVNTQLFGESVVDECILGNDSIKLDYVEEILKMLNLFNVKDQHPMTLSGGQKQRLAIAVAILCEKKIIILDEPTSGLDYSNMKMVIEVIKILKNQGIIVIVISHDKEFTSAVCNKSLSLDRISTIEEKVLSICDCECSINKMNVR